MTVGTTCGKVIWSGHLEITYGMLVPNGAGVNLAQPFQRSCWIHANTINVEATKRSHTTTEMQRIFENKRERSIAPRVNFTNFNWKNIGICINSEDRSTWRDKTKTS